MNKKGFTLIELIGVIVLISLMVLIIIPTVDKVIKQGQEVANQQLESNILLAAQNWASDHKTELKSLQKGWHYNLLITTLKELGYIDKSIKLPTTKEEYTKTNCVVITKTSDIGKKATYEYDLEFENQDCMYEFNDNILTISAKEDNYIGKALSSGTWTKENVRLTATSNSQYSGTNLTYRWFNNNTLKEATNTNEYVVKINNNDVKTFKYTVRLIADGTSTQSSDEYVVKIDKKSPTLASTFTYNNGNILTVSIDETGQSGISSNQKLYYALSTSNTSAPSSYNSLDITAGEKATLTIPNNIITALTTGTYYLWIKEGIKDNVGNVSKAKKIGGMAIDNTKPTCTLTAPTSITYSQTGNFTLKCTDTGSKLTGNKLTANNFEVTNLQITNVGNPTAITNGYQYIITAKATSGTGTGTLALKAGAIKDKAANGNDKVSKNTSLARLKTATTGSCKSLTYNGSPQTLASGATNASYSNNSRTAAGSQTVTVTANTNYAFSDGTTSKTLSCSIARLKTATTGSCRSLSYNGSPQTLASGATNASYSNNSRTAAGSQTVTVTANNNYAFSDGATSKNLSCSIAKINPTVTLSATKGIVGSNATTTFTEKANVAGSFSASSNSSGIAYVSSGSSYSSVGANTAKTVTVKGGSSTNQDATITVTFTPTDTTNYNKVTKSYVVRNESLPSFSENRGCLGLDLNIYYPSGCRNGTYQCTYEVTGGIASGRIGETSIGNNSSKYLGFTTYNYNTYNVIARVKSSTYGTLSSTFTIDTKRPNCKIVTRKNSGLGLCGWSGYRNVSLCDSPTYWYFEYNGSQWKIIPSFGGGMLDLEGDPGGHPGNPNVEIKPYSEGTTSDVYWRLSIIGGEYTYLIVNNYNGQCVDVYDGGFWSGNNIWAYNCWPTSDTLNSPAQQWYIWQ